MLPAIVLTPFDPVAVEIGPFAVRWYALAYITGLLLGWWLMKRLARVQPGPVSVEHVDDYLVWATLGVVLGGRLGYVLFYKPSFYFAHPLEILQVWQGGMAFHGGFLGVVVATILFCRKRRIPVLALGDLACAVAPIGLFFGRIANFINGELWGREAPADLPWAMVFPGGGPLPRHPSQLYEAALEGLVLFAVLMAVFWAVPRVRGRYGVLSGLFLAGYGLARFTAEFYREPDSFLGYLWGGATMGQLLSLPMIVLGLALAVWAWRRPAAADGNGTAA